MVTRTIYTDASMVVINIGKSAMPWRQETTYLLDPANGRTTRTQAQTVMPTPGVTESNIVYPATSIMNGTLIYTVITEGDRVITSIISTTTLPSFDDMDSEFEVSSLLSSSIVTSAPSNLTTITTTTPPATTTSASPLAGSSAPPTLTIIMGLAGGVLCLLLVGITYFFYRRHQQRKIGEMDSLDSYDSRLASSPSTPSSLEKGKDGSYFEKAVPHLIRNYIKNIWKGKTEEQKRLKELARQEFVSEGPETSWDPMKKEVGTVIQRSDDSSSSSEDSSLAGERSSEGGYQETESVMEERLYRLRSRNHSPPPLPPPSAGQDVPELPPLPPLPFQTDAEVQDLGLNRLPRAPESSSPNPSDPTSSNTLSSPPTSGTLVGSVSPKSVRRLTSILKAPPPAPTSSLPALTPDLRKWVETVQDRFGKGPGPRYEPKFAEPVIAPRKKGVTFGFEEVREFGDTPRTSLEFDINDDYDLEQGEDSVSNELGHSAEGLALKRALEDVMKKSGKRRE